MRNSERGQRVAFTLSKDLFAQFDKIVYINRFNAQNVLVKLVKNYIDKNQDSIDHYDKVFSVKSNVSKTQLKDSSFTNEQLTEAKRAIAQFTKNHQHQLINENDEITPDTIGIKLPSRNYIIIFKDKLNSLLDKKILTALKTRITLHGKTVHGIIKIEESELVDIS